ncbi:hypothetical protein SAMN05428965_4087 [Geodermatophilus sp. DSM 45219]|nr:hypothetical protein SAMN05428965_4087 [Geodermatophilus sp. DSM 45219]
MGPTTEPDAVLLLRHVDAVGLVVEERTRGWDHMGAVICDAALQPRCSYRRVVEPRVRRLVAAWPEATTVSRFSARLETSDIGATLPWRGPTKLRVISDLTDALARADVETVPDLRGALADPAGGLRSTLRTVRRVGPKTLDYLSILCGSSEHVAVDVHVRGFVRDAGVDVATYERYGAVVRAAARLRGCSPGALDAAIWQHMSRRRQVTGRGVIIGDVTESR